MWKMETASIYEEACTWSHLSTCRRRVCDRRELVSYDEDAPNRSSKADAIIFLEL